MSIKVAIDISPLKGVHAVRGVGSYTKNLTEAISKLKIENLKLKIEFIDFRDTSYPILHTKYNLIHYPYFDLFFLTLPLKKPTKTVVTIHDVIPLIFPQHYPPGIRGKVKFLIQKFSLKGVSAVITDSENSKKDIVKYLSYPEEKIHVIYLAPGENFRKLEDRDWELGIRKKYKLPDTFILYVGDVNWNKNIQGLVKAIKQLSNLAIKLVLVGKAFVDQTLPEVKAILQLIESLKIDDKVMRLGWVEEEDLVKIYNLATVYCQPSFYEGFGLPVLEAMVCGCPVVATNVASLPEICGEAALMVDPNDYNIARGLDKVIRDKKTRNMLIEKGLAQAKKFSWEKVARETLKVYEKMVEE